MRKTSKRFVAEQSDVFSTAFGTVVSGMEPLRYNGRFARDPAPDIVIEWPSRQSADELTIDSAYLAPTFEKEERPGKVAWAVPRIAPSQKTRLLQQFEGTIISFTKDEFVASLVDLTDSSRPEEEATFDLEEVSLGDRELVREGAKFRWNLGYRTNLEGQRDRVSSIRFLRIPGWRRSIVEAIDHDANAMMKTFSSNEYEHKEKPAGSS
jgi:hypothetical protein